MLASTPSAGAVSSKKWRRAALSGYLVMHMKIDHRQFQIDGDRLVHEPTGAVFWMGEKNVVLCDWGETTLASGHDYNREDLKEAAREIFLKDKTSCA